MLPQGLSEEVLIRFEATAACVLAIAGCLSALPPPAPDEPPGPPCEFKLVGCGGSKATIVEADFEWGDRGGGLTYREPHTMSLAGNGGEVGVAWTEFVWSDYMPWEPGGRPDDIWFRRISALGEWVGEPVAHDIDEFILALIIRSGGEGYLLFWLMWPADLRNPEPETRTKTLNAAILDRKGQLVRGPVTVASSARATMVHKQVEGV